MSPRCEEDRSSTRRRRSRRAPPRAGRWAAEQIAPGARSWDGPTISVRRTARSRRSPRLRARLQRAPSSTLATARARGAQPSPSRPRQPPARRPPPPGAREPARGENRARRAARAGRRESPTPIATPCDAPRSVAGQPAPTRSTSRGRHGLPFRHEQCDTEREEEDAEEHELGHRHVHARVEREVRAVEVVEAVPELRPGARKRTRGRGPGRGRLPRPPSRGDRRGHCGDEADRTPARQGGCDSAGRGARARVTTTCSAARGAARPSPRRRARAR